MNPLTGIAAAVQAGVASWHDESERAQRVRPFVTISRQAGAGARSLLDVLVDRLRELDPAKEGWAGYDRELVEKVAQDHGLHASLVERLEEASHSWLDDLIAGLAPSRFNQTELAVERRAAETIRGLAQRGRVVVVGRGGVFVTRDMPGGVHVHLVAPLKDRVARIARQKGLSLSEAEREVAEIDRNRQAFYKRTFPHCAHGPETFTLTLNTSKLDDASMTELIVGALEIGACKTTLQRQAA